MGASLSLEQQISLVLDQLQKDYKIQPCLKNSNDNHIYLKQLVSRKTSQKYLLKVHPTNSSIETQSLLHGLQQRNKMRKQGLIPIHTYYNQKIKMISGRSKENYYLIFDLQGSRTLEQQIQMRRNEKRMFEESQLIEGFKKIAEALAWMQGNQAKTEQSKAGQYWTHGNINSKTIYYSRDSTKRSVFMLSDPLMFTSTAQTKAYPSPQQLLSLRNKNNTPKDPFVSDLFSLAMTFLDGSSLGTTQQVYKNSMIDYQILRKNIQKCPYLQLKEILADVLMGSAAERKAILESYQKEQFQAKKIRLMSAEKNKRSKSKKDKGQQKLKLINSSSSSRLNTLHTSSSKRFPMTSRTQLGESTRHNLPRSPTGRQVSNFTCQSSYYTSGTTKLKFNYSTQNLQNKNRHLIPTIQSFVFQPSYSEQSSYVHDGAFNFNDVQGYIKRINKRLQQLQNGLEQTIRSNTRPVVVLSKSSVEQQFPSAKNIERLDDVSSCQNTVHIKSTSTSKANEQTNQADQSQIQQYLFKDSLKENLSEQFQYVQVSSEPLVPISYTINQSKITTGQVSQAQSLDQQLLLQDSTSYVVNLKGTQIQKLSGLVIPQEPPSLQQSCGQEYNAQNNRGQFIEEQYSNGSSYRGFMVNGMRHGPGTFHYAEGGYYQGNWKCNKMNGLGKLYYDNHKVAYQGMWYEDSFHGRGRVFNDEPLLLPEECPFNYQNFEEIDKYWLSYEGDFSHDMKEGYGILTFSNGYCYRGEFHHDRPQGKGYFEMDGKQIKCVWVDGVITIKI